MTLKPQGQRSEKLPINSFMTEVPIYRNQSINLQSMKELIVSDKSNLLRKAYFLLKSGFQVIAFFYSFGVRIPCYNWCKIDVYKWARQLFSGHYKMISDWFIFSKYFSDWWVSCMTVTWLYYFSKWDIKIIAIKL